MYIVCSQKYNYIKVLQFTVLKQNIKDSRCEFLVELK